MTPIDSLFVDLFDGGHIIGWIISGSYYSSFFCFGIIKTHLFMSNFFIIWIVFVDHGSAVGSGSGSVPPDPIPLLLMEFFDRGKLQGYILFLIYDYCYSFFVLSPYVFDHS